MSMFKDVLLPWVSMSFISVGSLVGRKDRIGTDCCFVLANGLSELRSGGKIVGSSVRKFALLLVGPTVFC